GQPARRKAPSVRLDEHDLPHLQTPPQQGVPRLRREPHHQELHRLRRLLFAVVAPTHVALAARARRERRGNGCPTAARRRGSRGGGGGRRDESAAMYLGKYTGRAGAARDESAAMYLEEYRARAGAASR